MTGAIILLSALLAAGGPDGPPDAKARSWRILPPSAVTAMLDQCSRSVPQAGEDSWQPAPADIERLEALLPSALASSPALAARSTDFSQLLTRWGRQYVGIVRDGRRFVYGNFFPVRGDRPPQVDAQPLIVCDGGPAFFGV